MRYRLKTKQEKRIHLIDLKYKTLIIIIIIIIITITSLFRTHTQNGSLYI